MECKPGHVHGTARMKLTYFAKYDCSLGFSTAGVEDTWLKCKTIKNNDFRLNEELFSDLHGELARSFLQTHKLCMKTALPSLTLPLKPCNSLTCCPMYRGFIW